LRAQNLEHCGVVALMKCHELRSGLSRMGEHGVELPISAKNECHHVQCLVHHNV
jgi:hypothetical protein